MRSIGAELLAEKYADVGLPAVAKPAAGAALAVVVLWHAPDARVPFGHQPLIGTSRMIRVRANDWPNPVRGDVIMLEGSDWRVQSVESTDPQRLEWTLGVSPP
ncbi:putative Phage head-tail adaptor [uncultured Gammaproteobacteria bacterium]